MLTIYEAVILFKVLPKEELAGCMKRAAGFIFDKGGFLRNLKYLGLQRCPYRQSKNKNPFWEAHYTFYEFHAPKIKVSVIYTEMQRDEDIIKHSFIPKEYPSDPFEFQNCTFEQEMATVPERPHVQEYIERAKLLKEKRRRGKLGLNMNTDFYPFQR